MQTSNVIPPIEYNKRKYWPPVYFTLPNNNNNKDNNGNNNNDNNNNSLENKLSHITSLASFGTCAISHLSESSDRIYVEVEFGIETGLVLKYFSSPTDKSVAMEHSLFCPMRHLDKEAKAIVIEEEDKKEAKPKPPVKVGISVVIEHAQSHKILLTRRSSVMRTFPHVWVVPGGHMEIGETLKETAVREVFEETGITLDTEKITLLAVYESVYPVILVSGPPTDHHIVVYLKAIVDVPETELILQVAEVDAAAWVDKTIVENALAIDKTQGLSSPSLSFPAFELCAPEKDDESEREDANEKVLEMRKVEYDVQRLRTDRERDGTVAKERLSTGCRFALREWMARL